VDFRGEEQFRGERLSPYAVVSMADVNLKNLVAKLNEGCRRTLEQAAGLVLSRTNHYVEIEHWLMALLDQQNNDFNAILRNFEIDPSRVKADLTKCLDQLKTGNSRAPALSQRIVDWVREGWVIASVEFGVAKVRSGHLILALLSNSDLARVARDASSQFSKINPDSLKQGLNSITANSDERDEVSGPAGAGKPGGAPGEPGKAGPPSKTPSLDQFTIDLTRQAAEKKLDPVLGRDTEIRQLIDILTRRRQNNPILTGEAGVGKTAVVEGFALRIAAKDVPPPLQNVRLLSLDLGLLQAGAGVKGEFENRLKSVIEEVKSSLEQIIMFIYEAHTMIWAGGQFW